MKHNFWKTSVATFTLSLALTAIGSTAVHAGHDSSYTSNIQRSLYHLQTAGAEIQRIIHKISSGGHSERPPMVMSDEDLNENDWAAQRALLGLKQKNEATIESMEQAIMSGQICDPCVKRQLCGDIRDLHRNIRAGRVAANLPVRGYATPQDFDDIAEEVNIAGQELGCY